MRKVKLMKMQENGAGAINIPRVQTTPTRAIKSLAVITSNGEAETGTGYARTTRMDALGAM